MSDPGTDCNDCEQTGSEPGVNTLESLPNRPLTATEYKALELSDSLSGVSPLVEDSDTGTVNGISLVFDDVYGYYVWHPENRHWEQVVRIDSTDADEWEIEAVEILDDDTGEVMLTFTRGSDSPVEDVYRHIRAYINHVYGGLDGLWFIPEETGVP